MDCGFVGLVVFLLDIRQNVLFLLQSQIARFVIQNECSYILVNEKPRKCGNQTTESSSCQKSEHFIECLLLHNTSQHYREIAFYEEKKHNFNKYKVTS